MRSITLALLLIPAVAQAGITNPTVQTAMRSLTRYDVHGEGTTRVLADLGEFIRVTHDDPARREARFVRAVAATDLLVIAAYRGDRDVPARVAESLGYAPEELLTRLDSELANIDAGVLHRTVQDARAALRALAHEVAPADVLAEPTGSRRDALYIVSARHAATQPELVRELAALGSLECDECGAIAAHTNEEGRRAVSAVVEVFAALERIHDRARRGDPFAGAMVHEIVIEQGAFERIDLPLEPNLGDLGLGGAGPRAAAVRPDVVLAVHEGEVRYGWLPRVTFEDGAPHLASRGTPVLPATASISFPEQRPFPTEIDEVTAWAREALDRHRVGVGAGEGEAHLLTRVLLSLREAGHGDAALVGTAPDGLHGVALHLARDSDAESTVHVHVRLGGHSLRVRSNARTAVPRVRDEDGSWRMDFDALHAQVPPSRSTSVRFMQTVTLQNLAETVFHVAPEDRTVTLVP